MMGFQPLNVQSLARFNSALASNILDIYQDALKDRIAEERSEPPSRTFAPSSMRCERISWFRLRGVPPERVEEPDIGLDFTAKMGTACHDLIQEALSRTKYWVPVDEYVSILSNHDDFTTEKKGYETRITLSSPPIRFACDGVLKIDNEYILIEIKSCEHSSFMDLANPKPHHIYQAKGYGVLLNIDRVVFIYIDRNYGDVKAYEIHVTPEDKTSIVNMFSRVQEFAEMGIAPQPLPRGDVFCNQSMCPYYTTCYKYGR